MIADDEMLKFKILRWQPMVQRQAHGASKKRRGVRAQVQGASKKGGRGGSKWKVSGFPTVLVPAYSIYFLLKQEQLQLAQASFRKKRERERERGKFPIQKGDAHFPLPGGNKKGMAALHLNLHEIPQSSSIPRGHRHTCHLKRSPLSQLESPKIWEDLRQIVKSKVLTAKWSMHVNASNADKLRYQLLPKSPEIQAGELAMDISETSCQHQPAQCSTFSTSFDKLSQDTWAVLSKDSTLTRYSRTEAPP